MKILVFILFFFCVDIHPEERVYTIVVLYQKRDLCQKGICVKKMSLCQNVPICQKITIMSQKRP